MELEDGEVMIYHEAEIVGEYPGVQSAVKAYVEDPHRMDCGVVAIVMEVANALVASGWTVVSPPLK